MNKIKIIVAVAISVAILPACTFATSFVGSAAAINANDSITWAQLGASGGQVSNPKIVSSVSGKNITLSQATGAGFTSTAGVGYGPMYAPGERLYLTDNGFGFSGGPITFVFRQDIDGFGLVCDPDYFSAGFSGTISAYDAAANLLGSFAFSVSAQAQYKQVFAGVSNNIPNIHRIVIDGTAAASQPENFAIGTVLIHSDRIFSDGLEP